jgi:hypothetical protein
MNVGEGFSRKGAKMAKKTPEVNFAQNLTEVKK